MMTKGQRQLESYVSQPLSTCIIVVLPELLCLQDGDEELHSGPEV